MASCPRRAKPRPSDPALCPAVCLLRVTSEELPQPGGGVLITPKPCVPPTLTPRDGVERAAPCGRAGKEGRWPPLQARPNRPLGSIARSPCSQSALDRPALECLSSYLHIARFLHSSPWEQTAPLVSRVDRWYRGLVFNAVQVRAVCV